MSAAPRRAAYVQLRADYFGRPFDDGIIRALLAAGYEVDIYAPDGDLPQDVYPATVRRYTVEFRRSWLAANAGRSRWRRYGLFLGNPDLGSACAAVLARAVSRPFVNACEEVYFGGYEGSAIGWWRTLARWAARRARFTVITDLCRAGIQREYAGLGAAHRFLPYPSCYPIAYAGPDRGEVRRGLRISNDESVLSVSGALTEGNAAHWILGELDRIRGRLLIQPGNRPDAVLETLVARLANEGRATYLPERVPWLRAAELTAAADTGTALYLSPKPQFQLMGVSSQKLGTCLWLGIPVVATRQPSFEFIRDFGCGVLIDRREELAGAIEAIRSDAARFSAGAARAVAEYVRPAEKVAALTEAFASLA